MSPLNVYVTLNAFLLALIFTDIQKDKFTLEPLRIVSAGRVYCASYFSILVVSNLGLYT